MGVRHLKKQIILYISIILNILFLVGIVEMVMVIPHKGGTVDIKTKLSSGHNQSVSPLILVHEESNSIVNNTHHDVVFLGDSHTDFFEWGEYFPNLTISNQGISGDTTGNILKRLDQVNKDTPNKIFLLAGINDIRHGKAVTKIASNYQKIIANIREHNPTAKIYAESIFHVNNKKYPRYYEKDVKKINKNVDLFNQWLEKYSKNAKNVIFINNQLVLHDQNQLSGNLTVDGLHLNKTGYLLWANSIHKYIYEK